MIDSGISIPNTDAFYQVLFDHVCFSEYHEWTDTGCAHGEPIAIQLLLAHNPDLVARDKYHTWVHLVPRNVVRCLPCYNFLKNLYD